MATHDKRLRRKEAKRSRLRRIADGEDVDDDEDDDEFSDDSEDDDGGTDRREEVRRDHHDISRARRNSHFCQCLGFWLADFLSAVHWPMNQLNKHCQKNRNFYGLWGISKGEVS